MMATCVRSMTMSGDGFVAVLVIELHFPDAGSLKGKRKELSSIKSQLHGRLGVAVAETGAPGLWQRATLTAALTGGSLRRLSAAADEVERWVLARCPGERGLSGCWRPWRICEDEVAARTSVRRVGCAEAECGASTRR